MGIKGLLPVIKEHAPGAISLHHYEELRGQGFTLAMDGYLNIHQSVAAIRAQNYDLLNDRGEMTSHLMGTLRKVISYVSQGITPIYVFDGDRHDIKQVAREERRVRLEKALDKAETTLPDTIEWVRAYQACYYVTDEDVQQVILLLDMMGVPHLTAPYEADPVCVYLTTLRGEDGQRLVKGVCSDDTDMMPLGCQFTFRQMSGHLGDRSQFQIVKLSRVLREMNLDLEGFIDLCVLLGTDYNRNLYGIGPKRAYAAISRDGSLDSLLESREVPDEQLEQIQTARRYFRTEVKSINHRDDYQEVREQVERRGLGLEKMRRGQLAEWLVNRHSFDLDNVVEMLDQYERAQDALGL